MLHGIFSEKLRYVGLGYPQCKLNGLLFRMLVSCYQIWLFDMYWCERMEVSLGIVCLHDLYTRMACVCVALFRYGSTSREDMESHDDGNMIKWQHFPRYWPFVRGIQLSPVNSPHKAQWTRALMIPLICVWINGRANNREAGDLRRYRVHYDVIVMDNIITMLSNVLE